MSLPPCTICGNPHAIAFAPGGEGETFGAGMIILRPISITAWCIRCWPAISGASAPAEIEPRPLDPWRDE